MRKVINRYSIIAMGIVSMLCLGVCNLWNIFLPMSLEYYGWQSSSATMVHTVLFICTVAGNMLGAWASDRIGSRKVACIGWAFFTLGFLLSSLVPRSSPRLLYFTYSFLMAFGAGLCYSGILTSTQRWWVRKKGAASGMVLCAYGFSVTLLAPIAEALHNGGMSLPGIFRTFGIGFGVIVGVGCYFFKQPDEQYIIEQLSLDRGPASAEPAMANPPKSSVMDIVKNKNYYKLLFCMICGAPLFSMMNAQIKIVGTYRGLSESLAVFTVMACGIGSACGRLLLPRLADRIGSKKVMLMDYSIVLAMTLSLIFARGYFYIACIFCLAVIYGGGAAMTPVLASDCFGIGSVGTNISMLMVSAFVGAMVFPTLGGYLTTNGATTVWMFIIPMVTEIAAIVVMSRMQFAGMTREKRGKA